MFQAQKPETVSGPSSLNIWKFFLEDLVSPVNVADTVPRLLSACKPGVPLEPWLWSLKPTADHPLAPLASGEVAGHHLRKPEMLFLQKLPICLCALEAGMILCGCFDKWKCSGFSWKMPFLCTV